jgi:hypothetical protein
VHYVNNLLYYFLPIQRLLYVGVLILALLLGWLPIGTVTPTFAVMVVVVLLVSMTASLVLARGRLDVGEGTSNVYLSAEIYLRALVVTALRRKSGFKVTPKSISDMDMRQRFRVLALPTIVAAIIAVSWLLRASQEAFGSVLPGVALPGMLTPLTFGILTLFTVVELVTITPMLWREYRRKQQRYRWRFRCDIPARVDGRPATITDLHEAGLSFAAAGAEFAVGSELRLEFTAPLGDQEVAVHGKATIVRSTPHEDGSATYGCTAVWASPEDRRSVIDLCYVFLAAQDRGYVEAQAWSVPSP